MNRILYKYILFSFCVILSYSCSDEKTEPFKGESGLIFKNNDYSFSFLDNAAAVEPDRFIVRIPILLSGRPVSYDREVTLAVVKDSTTANESQYELTKATLKENQAECYAEVILHKDVVLESTTAKLVVKLVENKDFSEFRLGKNIYAITFTAKIMKPDNWEAYIGTRWFGLKYSDSWWRFCIDAMGVSSIPVWFNPNDDRNPDPERWWMYPEEGMAYAYKVRVKLKEYNAEHPDDPLKHMDGPYAGDEVVMVI